MSGTFPTSPGPATVKLSSNQPVIVSTSESGKRKSRIQGGHLWIIKMTWVQMLRTLFSPIFAFAVSQRGGHGTFQISLPNFNTPQGIATGTPLVNGIHTAGDETISTDGWTNSITDIMKGGDVLKFSSHSKVYMVTANANSGTSTGPATLSIVPPLIENLADNEVITVNNVEFTVAFTKNITDWNTSAPTISTFTADMVEAI